MSRVAAGSPKGIGAKLRMLLDLVKFEHSVFALPYAYIGALYGAATVQFAVPAIYPAPAPQPTSWVTLAHWPTVSALLWITVVMVGARSFAFVVNRAVDKEIDARNPRTADRAIPAGLIRAGELWLFAAVMLGAFLYGVWRLAPICRTLWPIVLAVFIVYPYVKRFSPLCHYWLGLCLGLAPVGGWVAVGASISGPAPWLFGAAVLLWTAGFDIIYATQDIECDIRDHVHSMPADYGISVALVQTRVAHALTVVLLIAAGVLAAAGWVWFTACAVAAGLLAYENLMVRADDLSRVNAAFFTMNGVIAVMLGIGAIVDRLLG